MDLTRVHRSHVHEWGRYREPAHLTVAQVIVAGLLGLTIALVALVAYLEATA